MPLNLINYRLLLSKMQRIYYWVFDMMFNFFSKNKHIANQNKAFLKFFGLFWTIFFLILSDFFHFFSFSVKNQASFSGAFFFFLFWERGELIVEFGAKNSQKVIYNIDANDVLTFLAAFHRHDVFIFDPWVKISTKFRYFCQKNGW